MEGAAMAMERALGRTEKNWCKAVESGTGITIVAFSISSKIEVSRLRSVLFDLQNSFQILRAKLPHGGNSDSFAISPDPYLEIEFFDSSETYRIVAGRIGDSGEVSAFQCLVEHDLNRNPWVSSAGSDPTPTFYAAMYDLPESESTVVSLRLHSAVGDRVSGSSILRLILDVFSGVSSGEMTERSASPPIEEMTSDLVARKPLWARGMNIVGYTFSFTKSAYLPFLNTSAPRTSEIVRMIFTAEETSKFIAGCELRGVKRCSAITAAILLATAASKGIPPGKSESYTVLTFVNSRKLLKPKLDSFDLGFYHSAIQNLYSVKQEEDLWEVAKRCHGAVAKAMDENKQISDMGDLNMLMRKAIDNPFLTPSSSMRTAMVSVFEEAVEFPSCEGYRAAGVKDFVACSSVHGVSPCIAVFDSMVEGQLHCDCLYPSPLHSREQIRAVVDRAKSLLLG
ncbi:GATA zinc finger protein [Wolffia australiana]